MKFICGLDKNAYPNIFTFDSFWLINNNKYIIFCFKHLYPWDNEKYFMLALDESRLSDNIIFVETVNVIIDYIQRMTLNPIIVFL